MHSIDVYIFIFNNKTDAILNSIAQIDYPQDKMNITAFTDREIKHSYNHHMTSEKEAYNFVRINSHAEYIWLLYADYIVNQKNLLKDCLNENRDIISGLMIKPKSMFANFGGKVSAKGWYERSDDYLEIFEMKKVGCFKVPYITGNILFKADAFKRNPKLTVKNSRLGC